MNSNDNTKAIDAIWKTELNSSDEKLILYHLASKHELGDRYSSSWKAISQFLSDFSPKWSSLSELTNATQLSDVKILRAIASLEGRNFLETKQIPVKLNKKQDNRGETQTVYAITTKIFADFQALSSRPKAAMA